MSEQDPEFDEDISMYPPEDFPAEFPENEGPELPQDPYDLGQEEGEDL